MEGKVNVVEEERRQDEGRGGGQGDAMPVGASPGVNTRLSSHSPS